MSVSLIPPGLSFVRSVIARSHAGAYDAADFAAKHWHDAELQRHLQRAAVAPLGGDELASLGSSIADEFLTTQVLNQAIVGRLGLLMVPFSFNYLKLTGGATAHWVGEGAPAPFSKQSLEEASLPSRKLQAVTVVTADALRVGNRKNEARLRADLQRSTVELLDGSFIDVSNSGSAGVEPASVTNGVTPISSTGNPGDDIVALLDEFTGDLASAVLVADPRTLARMALARDSAGGFAFPDLGVKGGSILGIPVLASRHSPIDSSGGQLTLLDPSRIAANVEQLSIDKAEHATVQLADDPDDPTDATTVLVSLWQRNLVALRTTIFANWTAEDGAVAVVTDADYSTAIAE